MMSLRLATLVALALTQLGTSQTFPNPGCTLIRNPPANPNGNAALCNVRGVVNPAPTNGTVITANNYQQCQNLCLRRQSTLAGNTDGFVAPACSTLIYNSTSKACTVFDYDASSQFTPRPKAVTTVSQGRCYSCPSTCPSTPGVNLFDNPGFELSSTLYGPWQERPIGGPTSGKVVKPGRNSPSAFMSQGVTDTDGTGWLFQQTINACRNRRYFFSFDYKAQYGTTIVPQIYIFTSGFNYILQGTSRVPSGAWQSFSGYLYSLDGYDTDDYGAGSVRDLEFLTLLMNNVATVRPGTYSVTFDNFQLSGNGTELIAPTGKELMGNPGFESGKAGAWNITFSKGFEVPYSVRKPGITGNYALHVEVQNDPKKFFDTEFFLQQDLTAIVLGATYVIQFDLQTVNELYITLHVGMAGIYIDTCRNGVPCNGTFQRPFVAMPGIKGFEMQVQRLTASAVDGSAAPAPIILDNISVKKA